MDNTFETYEFIPTSNVETAANQFFVVQDDGTFLINRQTQYVAQVPGVKDVLEEVQPCTVYDVSSQQFYVDVDNTTELISVPGQFILPAGENLYDTSYLLQPGTSTNEPMEDAVVAQGNMQDANRDPTQTSTLNNSCTEITISDEQYKMLERKGWVLLESNDKVFVLNTLGLHDITTNDRLVQKLKTEVQSNVFETDPGYLQGDIATDCSYPSTSNSNLQGSVELVEASDSNVGVSEETIESLPLVNTAKDADSQTQYHENQIIETPCLENASIDDQSMVSIPEPIEVTTCKNEHNNGTSVKIKTKMTFKDIPDKIFLGTTINNKRLVAKVVKSQGNKRSITRNEVDPSGPEIAYKKITKKNCMHITGLDETQFLYLLQMALRGDPPLKCSAKDVTAAESVIAQILRLHSLKKSIVGHNLVITKIINTLDEAGKITSCTKPTFVSGIITAADDTDDVRFEHIPNLIQRLKSETEKQHNIGDATDCSDTSSAKAVNIFHINIWETRCARSGNRVSVTLNKRKLSLDLISDLNKRHPSTVYACRTCAAIFKSEETLKDHQENQCLESSDVLTKDTNKINDTSHLYTVIKHGDKNMYTCSQCKAKFSRLTNCQKHMKTHSVPSDSKISENMEAPPENKQINKVYKCDMCPSTYFHLSTLSKHILTKHIKGKQNK